MDKDYRPLGKSGIERRQMGSETILYNPQNDKVSLLNETASLVWEMCDGKHTLSDMEAKIRKSFVNIPKDRDVIADIKAALEQFRKDGILQA